MRLLLADYRDSFTFNVAHALHRLGAEVIVRPGEELLDSWEPLRPEGLLLGPGPGRPERLPALRRLTAQWVTSGLPLLGICLGHQAIAHHFGAELGRAPRPMHGRTSLVHHEGGGLFEALPRPVRMMRYHSLLVLRLSAPLRRIAWTATGETMAIEVPGRPIHGVQFHPESFLSDAGDHLLANWLRFVRSTHRSEPHSGPPVA